MNNKPKITFRKNGEGYTTNEEIICIDYDYLMEELENHIAREKKVKEILGIDEQ